MKIEKDLKECFATAKKEEKIVEEAKQENGHKFYKITVTNYYLFDGREVSPGQKYKLPWKNN